MSASLTVPERGAAPAVDRVVAGLLQTIRNDLAPGAQLASEAEIATSFGVSRLTVREAVKVLAGRGLLDVGRGRRAIVRQPDGSAFSDILAIAAQHDTKSFFDLMEVRQALEVQSATLAAKRVNRAGLAAIEAALAGMEAALPGPGEDAGEEFNRFDVGFHEALALASGNRMLTLFLEALSVPLARSFSMSTQGRTLRGHTHAGTVAAHRAILDCVRQGDSRGAAQAMRAHLKDAEQDLQAVFGRGLQ
jgi:GntR family transcriptional regulator, transcriptional repressor for pyruvate dehydrogenase complex